MPPRGARGGYREAGSSLPQKDEARCATQLSSLYIRKTQISLSVYLCNLCVTETLGGHARKGMPEGHAGERARRAGPKGQFVFKNLTRGGNCGQRPLGGA